MAELNRLKKSHISPPRFTRDIRMLAVARLISEMGDELALIALLFRLKDAGPGAVSALLGVFAATRILVAPVSGLVVDRVSTRRLIALVSLGQAVVAVLLSVTNGGMIFLLVFLLAVGGSIIGPAWNSFIAYVVPSEELSRTYAFIQSYRSLAIVTGAAVGGYIVERLGSSSALLIDAATFLFVGFIGATLQDERTPSSRREGVKGMAQGFAAFVRSPVLLWSLVLLASFNMSAGVIEVLSVFLVTDELGGSASDYGLILGSLGASMFLSGLVLSRHPLVGRDTTWLMVSALLSAAGMAAYGLSTGIWMAMAAFFLNGIGLSGLHIFGTPILVRHTKEQERGRVFAASSSVTMGGMLLATGVAGAIGELFPPRPIIVCAALVCGLNALIGGAQIRRHDTVAGEGSSGSTR